MSPAVNYEYIVYNEPMPRKATKELDLLSQAMNDPGRTWVSGDENFGLNEVADPDKLARLMRAATPLPGFSCEAVEVTDS